MAEPAPDPDESPEPRPVTVPRLAATVILLRGGDDDLQVLLVRRTPQARFMAGAWVFPGGAVDPEDGEGQAALRAAGIREVHEEAGIALDADAEIVAFSNWITPEAERIRYDTWFFVTPMPDGQEPTIDGSEIVDARWMRPADALAAAGRDEMMIVFPTAKHLERVAEFGSAGELLSLTRGRTVGPVQPRIIGSGEHARVVLPGEPGYDD